jgi:hypothetical protein
MPSISFNTTSVLALNTAKTLYKTAVPLDESTGISPAQEALVYSTNAVAEGKPVPLGATYLKNADDTYFSIQRDSSTRLNLVTAGTDLNLYVYSPPTSQDGKESGSINQYVFDSTGKLKAGSPDNPISITNALGIAAAENTASLDLDGNGTIGGNVNLATGTLDKLSNLYKVKVAGQDLYIVDTPISKTTAAVDIAASVLKSNATDPWAPEKAYSGFTMIKSGTANSTTWDIYAREITPAVTTIALGVTTIITPAVTTVTQFSFDNTRTLKSGFSDGKVLNAQELASIEKSSGINLNGDSILGAAVSSIDVAGGLYKGRLLNQDFYIVAPAAVTLKTGTTKATATDLSGALLDTNGAWELSATQSIKSLVQTKNGSGAVIGSDIYVKDTSDNQLKRFSFTKNSDGNFELNDNSGGAIDGIELAKQEKATTRDLNNDNDFGIKVGKALDTVGGLFVAEALGQKFLVASKSLVSNSKSVADLSSALTTADGAAWIPSEILSDDGIVAKNPNEGINIHVSSATTAEVYVKKGSDFTKYEFTKASGAPWVISGNSELMLAEEMVALEKTLKRDFNNDRFIGAVVYGTPIASGLYTAKYGNETADLGNATPIYIYSSTKLALGNTVAANAKDFTSALKFSDSTYWKPTEDFNIKGAYVENGKYNIIATKGIPTSPTGSPSASSNYSVERYTFSLTSLELDANADPSIDAKELARVEKMQKADLNGDGITGVKAATNSVIDKVGLLFKVQAYDGIYFSTKSSASTKIEDLSQAFLNEDGTAWEPANFSDATTKLTLRKLTTVATESAPTQYEIYRSDGTAGNRTFSKYSFDASMKMIDSPTDMSLLEVANAEHEHGRDINDDKIIGAKIEKVIDKDSGLYQVTIENKKMLVQSASSLVKTSSLQNVLLDEDSNPIVLNSNGQIVDDGVAYNVDSMFRKDANTLQVFGSKTIVNGFEYKKFEFQKKAEGEFKDYFSLSALDVLTAKELVSLEKSSGKDINSDKSIGAKISTFSNDKGGQLYSAKILGDDYYFFAETGRKIGSNIGTTTTNAVDFNKAFLDSDGNAWKPPTVAAGTEKWNIAGVVENKPSGTITGYDIYVYQKAATTGDFNVKKYSWNADFVYQVENPVDAAALVKLETDAKRDFSGDGIIGFKIGLTPPAYQGVTRAKVMGGDSEDKFYIVGDFSKQIKQFGLSDALLNSAGTGAWILDDVKFKITSVVAGTGSTAGNRFVYAQNLLDSSMTRFTFSLSDGKYVSNSEVKLSDAQFAEEESKFKKDLNYDTRIGVASVENIRIDAKVSAPGGTLTNTGNTGNKSSGLTKASINSIDYLLVRDTPSATATTTLNKALMLSDGVTAWKPENNFHIKGVFNPSSGDTEIYGTMGLTGDLRKYVFESSDMPGASDAPLSLTGAAIPKVLKLKLVGGDAYSTVTQKEIAIREASTSVGKDLNGDGAIGFQVNPSAAKVTTADGTTLTSTVVDAIYVLGKNTDKFGNSLTNTANSNALVEDDDADVATPNTFWKPQDGYQVKSINKISDTEVHVLAGNTADSDSLIQYKFQKEGGIIGWKLKEASTTLDTQAVIALETSLRRNMNADSSGSIGLKYSNKVNTDETSVTNLISGSIGTKKYLFVGQEMATLGTTVKPFGLDNVSGPNLLKKSDGSAWVLPATDTTINYFRPSTANDITGVPTTIKASNVRFTMEMNTTGKTYFDSDYKQLVPMLTKGTFAVATKNIDENRNGGFFVPETFVSATNNQALTFSATYKLASSSTYGAVSTLSESNTNWLQFDPTSKMFSVKNPDNEFVGAYDIKVKATDAEGRYVEDKVFTLNINNTNDTPVALAASLPDLVATIGSPVTSYVIPMTSGNMTFSDIDVGDILDFTATLADGTSPLPSWLTFTSSGSTISLSADSVPDDAEDLTVRITATDSATIPKSVYKDLNVVINKQPYVELDDNNASTLIDKVATIGTAFTYDVSSIFTDDDATDTLTFAAKKSDGTDLPLWLLFNVSTKTFSSSGNVPSTAQNLSIKVTVTDSKGSSKDDVFDITVNNAPVSVVKIDNKYFDKLLTTGTATFDITSDLLGAFADADTVADADLDFTFQVKKGNGEFGDEVNGELTFTGNVFTYTDTADGQYTIEVTAKDTRNSTVSSTFDVTIAATT